MRLIFWCMRINSIILRIPVRIISTWDVKVIFISVPCQQSDCAMALDIRAGDCTVAAWLVSCPCRTYGSTRHTARQIDGDSGWGGGVMALSNLPRAMTMVGCECDHGYRRRGCD